jgi:hypothetical protein
MGFVLLLLHHHHQRINLNNINQLTFVKFSSELRTEFLNII